MAKIFLKGTIGLLIVSLAVTGCKKEEIRPEFEMLSFNSGEVVGKLPASLTGSKDASARECVGYIEAAMDMSLFIDNLVVPEDARKSVVKSDINSTAKSAVKAPDGGDEWYWLWQYGEESFTLFWTYNEDNYGKYWSMEIQYGDGPRYDYLDAWEAKEGGEGEVIYFFSWAYISKGEPVENYSARFYRYSWEPDDSGIYMYNWYYESEDPEFTYQQHYDLTINPDGSGTFDYYSKDALFYHSGWDLTGNGSSIFYLGDFEQTGSWTAG